MLNFIGSSIIICSSLLFGIGLIIELQKELDDIKQTILFFEALNTEMISNSFGLSTAIDHSIQKTDYKYKKAFENLSKEIESSDTSTLIQAFENCDINLFEINTKQIIKNYFTEINGAADKQITNAAETAINDMKKILNDKSNSYTNNKKLIIYFCLFFGIFVVIMLI